MSADPAAVEALAKTLRKSIYGNAEGVDPEEREWLPREVAADLIGSDWLAARDAAMRAEGASVAFRETADAWQWGAWTVLTPAMKGRSGPALIIAAAQAAADWLRERADAPLDRTEGDT